MTGAREGLRGVARIERSRVVAGGIGMVGRRQVTPRWADDTVRRHVIGGGVPPGIKSGGGKSGISGSIKQVRNNYQQVLGFGGVPVRGCNSTTS